MNIFLKLGLLFVFSLIGARIARKFNLPNVTGYLIGGLLLGPSLFNVITPTDSSMINFVTELALAIIAFNIGGEFLLKNLKKLGKDIFIITIFEVLSVFILMFVLMYFILNQHIVFSLIIASMAPATAPAGTLMVINQYRAKGPLTNTILPITALDDALGVMIFGLALAISKVLIGNGTPSLLVYLLPLIEIVLSLSLGLVIGTLLARLAPKTKNEEELLGLILLFILINLGIAKASGLSPLLSGMMMGALFVNLNPNPTRVFTTINKFASPFNILFFSLAGARLDLSVLGQIGLLGAGYVLARFTGKVVGSSLGAKVAKSPKTIQKYLGLALLPEGGVSIGLSLIVAQELPQFSSTIIPVVLFSVLIFEISGPIFAKFALSKAGEI